jgi:hypothetical protein
VFLEGTDGALGGVATVGVGGGELEVNAVGAEEGLLELVGGFVVEALVSGWKTFGGEFGVDGLVASEERGASCKS